MRLSHRFLLCVLLAVFWPTSGPGSGSDGAWPQRRLQVPHGSRTLPGTVVRDEARTPPPVPFEAATVVFAENFEGTSGFPPAGWITVNGDGGGTTGPWFQGNEIIFPAREGEGYAAANYQGANDFLIDEWLISPLIQSVGPSDTLVFWDRSPDGSFYADSIQVLLSTGDTALGSFATLVDYFQTSTIGWEERRYLLASHISPGSDIRIAFRYLLTDGGISGTNSDYAGLDNVQIRRPAYPGDITPVSVDDPAPGGKILTGQQISPLATFQNVGSGTQWEIPVRLRISRPSGPFDDLMVIIDSLLPGTSIQVAFGAYTPTETGLHVYRVTAEMDTDENRANDTLSITSGAGVLVAGTFTVGPGGSVPTLREAFDTLNNNILSGDVILELLGGEYHEPPLALGPLDYASSVTKIHLRPSAGTWSDVHVMSTSGEPFGIALSGVSGVTLDGSDGLDGERRITLNAEGVYGTAAILVEGRLSDNADSVTIRNMNLRTGADSLSPSGAYYGILITGTAPSAPGYGNTVSGCDITRHGSTGIGAQWQEGLRIVGATVHDWTQLSGAGELCGIWLADGVEGAVLSGNTIRNIVSRAGGSGCSGIEIGSNGISGTQVDNSMISGVLAGGPGTLPNFTRGIFASSMFNANDVYAYNSVSLGGTDSSTSASGRSAAMEFAGGTGIVVLNNILSNQMSFPGDAPGYRAFGIFLATEPAGFVSDHNDVFTPGDPGAAGYNGGVHQTLEEWRSSFSPQQDTGSIATDPLFVSADDLHIRTDTTSPVNNAGTPVTGITTDRDGTSRNPLTPDIGADEHTPGELVLRITYEQGWNLVSLPLRAADPRTTTLFPGAVSKMYSFDGSGYTAVDTLVEGRGYWVKFGSAVASELGGSPLMEDTVELIEGWNLVGSLSDPIAASEVGTEPPGILASRFYGYQGGYTDAAVLVPGKGYWVKAEGAGLLILRTDGQ